VSIKTQITAEIEKNVCSITKARNYVKGSECSHQKKL